MMKIWWWPVLLILENLLIQPIVCAVAGARETAMNSGGGMDSFTEALKSQPDLTSSNLIEIPKYDLKPKMVEAPGRQVDSNGEPTDPKFTKMLKEKVDDSKLKGDSLIQMVTDARTGNGADEESKKPSSFLELEKQQAENSGSVMTTKLPESLNGSESGRMKKMIEGDPSNPMATPKWARRHYQHGDEDKQLADSPGPMEASHSEKNEDPVEEVNQSSLNSEMTISADLANRQLEESKSKVDEKPEMNGVPIQQVTSHESQEGKESNTNGPFFDELSKKASEFKESNKPSSLFNNLESLKSTDLLNQASKIASQTSFGDIPIKWNDSQLREMVADPKLIASLASNGLNVENKEELLKTLTEMNNTNGGLLGAGLSMLSPQNDSEEDKPKTFGELLRLKFSLQHWKKIDMRDYFPNLYERFFGRW